MQNMQKPTLGAWKWMNRCQFVFGAQRSMNTTPVTTTVQEIPTPAIVPAQDTRSKVEVDIRPFNSIPGPRGLPYLGSWVPYKLGLWSTDNYHKNLLSMREKYGDIFKETISGSTILHLFDADDFDTVYRNSIKSPHTTPLLQPTKYYRIERKIGPGLGNLNGERWQQLKSAVQSVLQRTLSANLFQPLADEVARDFVTRIERIREPQGTVNDFGNELRKWNLESGFNMFMDTRLGCLNDDMDSIYQKMIDTNAEVMRVTSKLNYSLGLYHYFPTPIWRRHKKTEDFYFDESNKILQKALTDMYDLSACNNLDGRYLYLSHLAMREGLSIEDVQTLTISATFDGLNTTVPTIVGQLYLLATHPRVQESLYEEICRICPDKEAPITRKQIDQMTYLKACFKEGFRFFPIGSEITRVPLNDVVMKDCLIPAGTRVDVHTGLILRSDKYFRDPESYLPERWSRDSKDKFFTDQEHNPYLAIPFGFGHRMCVAKRTSEQEMYSLTIRLLQKYRLEWPHERRMEQRHEVLLFPDTEPDFKFVVR